MRELLLVGTGGFLGACLRYGVATALSSAAFPYATLLVNAAGSFALGIIAGLLEREVVGEALRPLVAVGLLGALTTFSTFSLETLALVEAGRHGAAALSVALNMMLAIGAAWLGLTLAS